MLDKPVPNTITKSVILKLLIISVAIGSVVAIAKIIPDTNDPEFLLFYGAVVTVTVLFSSWLVLGFDLLAGTRYDKYQNIFVPVINTAYRQNSSSGGCGGGGCSGGCSGSCGGGCGGCGGCGGGCGGD